MAKLDELFVLIKAMSKEEKRYFKLNSTKYRTGKSKDYLRLFDAIDAHDEYDEAAVRKKFKGEPYFTQFRNVKLYLQRQVMKSLKNFYDYDTENATLNSYLTEIEILYKKGLFKNCAVTIKKAKAYAEKHELFPKLLELIAWESRVALYVNDIAQIEIQKPKWVQEEADILEKYNELIQLRHLEIELTSFVMRHGAAKTDEEKDFVLRISKDKLLHSKTKSFRGEMNRLILLSMSLLTLDDFENTSIAMNQVLEYYSARPDLIYINASVYFGIMQELITVQLLTKKFIAADNLAQKMKSAHNATDIKLPAKNKIGFIRIETSLLFARGEFTEALGYIQQISELIKTSQKELDPVGELLLHCTCFDIYFRNKDFKNAQQYLQKIINSDSSLRLDLQSSARIINLILQYEQREFEHMGYMLRSTYRYLMKKQRLQKPEAIILDFIRDALTFTSERQVLLSLTELKKEIIPYFNEPFFLMGFPLIEWIESKRQNKELAEVVKENYKSAIAEEKKEMVGKAIV